MLCVATALLPVGEDVLDDQHVLTFFHKCFTMVCYHAAYKDLVYTGVEHQLSGQKAAFVPVQASKPVKNKN